MPNNEYKDGMFEEKIVPGVYADYFVNEYGDFIIEVKDATYGIPRIFIPFSLANYLLFEAYLAYVKIKLDGRKEAENNV